MFFSLLGLFIYLFCVFFSLEFLCLCLCVCVFERERRVCCYQVLFGCGGLKNSSVELWFLCCCCFCCFCVRRLWCFLRGRRIMPVSQFEESVVALKACCCCSAASSSSSSSSSCCIEVVEFCCIRESGFIVTPR